MARVCLVRPLLSPNEFSGYPLNLLILASCVREAGHHVEVCDFDHLKMIDNSWLRGGFARRAAREILCRRPTFVGITSMCSNYVLAIDLAQELKKRSPDVQVIFGGPHVSLCAKETLARYECVDAAVIGEGEITFNELIYQVECGLPLSDVLGIAYRKDGHVYSTPPRPLLENLDYSPPPAYDLVDIPAYIRTSTNSYLEIYAGSGCPFSCTFCSTSIVWKRKYRTMSPERIVGEMERLSGEYGATAFNLIHDNLTSGKRFIHRIAELIVAHNLHIRWGFSSRIDTIDLDTIRRVTNAGCDYVFFGVESGSEKIQQTMKKRLKLSRIHEVIGWCIGNGISPTTSFILGFPDEDLEDISSTIRMAFVCRAAGARRSFINLLSAYTGTPVMKEQIERMEYCRESMNTTMVTFLESYHFEIIASDRTIFANYYSLDYSGSALNAQEYSEMVDLFTNCLFRYRFVFCYLINDLKVDPILLFRTLCPKIRAMSARDRFKLGLNLAFEDVRDHVAAPLHTSVKAFFKFDESVWKTGTSDVDTMIYSGPIQISDGNYRSRIHCGAVGHYLLTKSSVGDVKVRTISSDLASLFEVQGMPVVRFDN